MARRDMVGFFWNDTPPPKPPKKEAEKKVPPPRTWENDDYLPNLAEALAFNVEVMTDDQLYDAMLRQEKLIFDIECYANYFLAAFRSVVTKKVWFIEYQSGEQLDVDRFEWVLKNFCTITFNGNNYDMPIAAIALKGCSTEYLKRCTNSIIQDEVASWIVMRNAKAKKIKSDHIDIIEVAPSQCSLKLYAGRLGTKRMQDLPFHPDKVLTQNQIACVRWYCLNDLSNTEQLYHALADEIKLRETMSAEYGIDLRSKSDAQIAEAVIAQEVEAITGITPRKPTIEIGTCYRFQTPFFIKYYSPTMQWALDIVQRALFVVGDSGAIGMPPELGELEIVIGNAKYKMGIGGLHSTEKSTCHRADENTILMDRDVTSYYPFIILNQGLFPQHLTAAFLTVYRTIVERRLDAKSQAGRLEGESKAATDKRLKTELDAMLHEYTVIADSLKITINGSFGKLGSPYSVLYAPDLLIQTTITGQLSLLMLIERLELSGIPVVSANTDGIVIKCPKHLKDLMDAIVKRWEFETNFNTEATYYKALYSRDVNNYIAIKEDGGFKAKGVYGAARLSKNPSNQICIESVADFIIKGIPIAKSIYECKDITKFATVRTVNGGAVKVWSRTETGVPDNIEYLGKAIRWYYGTNVEGELVYAKSGNKVPRSNGAQPMMDLPEQFPTDINYDWYETEANRCLADIGYC